MLFEIKDKNGKLIRLTNIGWKHIREDHPEVKIYEIFLTLEKPNKVNQSKYDETVSWYYRYDKKMKEYLMVSVKYLNGEAFVITSFYVKNIK